MKNLMKILLIIFGSLLIFSCAPRVKHPHNIPPGQAKKVMRTKSAKPHAPGQIKKRTGAKSAKPYAPGQRKKRGMR